MATYSAITSGQIDAESYIDTTLVGQWTNNVLAMFEGDASASSVRLQTAAIAASAVERAKIATSTVSLSGTASAAGRTDLLLSPYTFAPMVHCTGAGQSLFLIPDDTDHADPDDATICFYNTSNKIDQNYDVDYRYINV